jgi:ribose 5-phosphate isomerase B|uniref:Ribose 5-phosphate isomerase B n=1 Tax=viral metagenome TaxID=1070528 RepID=A0A6C0LWK0_9ZZZZ
MIIIGSDHGGYELKNTIKFFLIEKYPSMKCEDIGVYTTKSIDYPGVAQAVALRVLEKPNSFGIIICKSGIGMSIAANRFKGIRCALCHDIRSAELSRQHNNANIISLGSDIHGDNKLLIVDKFLNTEFEGGRHQRRIEKIDSITSKFL